MSLTEALKAEVVAFDIEHNPDTPVCSPDFEFWGCSFSWDDGKAIYIEDQDTVLDWVRALGKHHIMAAHYGQYDLFALRRIGLKPDEYPKNFVDTTIAMNVIQDELRENQLGLKYLIKECYEYEMLEFKDIADLPHSHEDYIRYVHDDVIWTRRLWLDLQPLIADQGFSDLCYKVLFPASKAFADMRFAGMLIDQRELNVQRNRLQHKVNVFSAEARKLLGDINLNSPTQIRSALYDSGLVKNLHKIPTTPTGKYSTNDTTLMKLAGKYPACKALVGYRTATKQLNTYVNKLLELANESMDGRIHARYHQTSSTGRTRSAGPNLQNITSRFKPAIKDDFADVCLKKAFVPQEDWTYVVADYSQIEYRLIADVTKDENLLSAYCDWSCECGECGTQTEFLLKKCPKCGMQERERFLKDGKGFWHGKDLHQQTADKVGVDRDLAKTVNFGLLYGATTWTLHKTLQEAVEARKYLVGADGKKTRAPKIDVSMNRCEEIREAFFEDLPGVVAWHQQCQQSLYENRQIRDYFGRRRTFSNLEFENSGKMKHALNQFVNFSPQASGSHLTQLAMHRTRDQLIKSGDWVTNAHFVNMVHDEIVAEVRDTELERIKAVLVTNMENCFRMTVPIRAEANTGSNWYEGK